MSKEWKREGSSHKNFEVHAQYDKVCIVANF